MRARRVGGRIGRAGRSLRAAMVVAAAIAGPGCGDGPAGRGTAPKPTVGRVEPRTQGEVTTRDYALRGVVRSVVPEAGRVLIRHEDIPGLMPAMTMPFTPEDESILGLLHPGDGVEGVLHVEKQDGAVRDYRLRDLKLTKPAPPPDPPKSRAGNRFEVRRPPPPLKVGEEVPDFAMTGQDGKRFRLSDLRGQVVVLTFIYTRCPMPDFCPLTDRKFSELAQKVTTFPDRARGIRMVSVSFDPEHDTPEVLRKHAAIRGASPPLWTFAVASHEELARVAPRLGLSFGPDGKEIAHNLCTAIIGPDGKLARLEVGPPANRWQTADFLRTIYGLLPRAGK